MIDWLALARQALWIIAVSVSLAAWSYASYRAAEQHMPWRQALGQPWLRGIFSLTAVAVAVSLAWGAAQPWLRLFWLVVAAGAAILAARQWRRSALEKGG